MGLQLDVQRNFIARFLYSICTPADVIFRNEQKGKCLARGLGQG